MFLPENLLLILSKLFSNYGYIVPYCHLILLLGTLSFAFPNKTIQGNNLQEKDISLGTT